MPAPLPWSPSHLDSFVSCPHSFHEQKVLKSIPYVQGEEAKWGEYVHKTFENYIRHDGTSLPDGLAEHKKFLDFLKALHGEPALEEKIALNKKLRPCGQKDADVFNRGIIDFRKNEGQISRIYDYKTGKPHTKFRQLLIYALWVFAMFPEVSIVFGHYYWTKTSSTTKQAWGRNQVKEMWGSLIPDLRQYKEAFDTDTWQKRQSGLCRGWCPVTSCEFWHPRRV